MGEERAARDGERVACYRRASEKRCDVHCDEAFVKYNWR